MVEVELVLLALAALFVVGAVAMLGATAVAAWTTARLAATLSTLVRPVVLGPTDIRDVELRVAGLRALDHVDSGVVTNVVPERRRGASGLARFSRRDGVRLDLALATPDDRTATVWVPVPEALTGGSRFERIAAACDVPPEEISDAVGTELPLVRGADGGWRIGSEGNRGFGGADVGDDATRERSFETERV
ncbi:hypothetical protein C5B91_11530 [Haloferax sp. Atlit-10N]|uniref:Uncharacterized protein n=1 Tax=Haloferax prahovense (strain DSM 18310 / JCM 13924 / TL6) TaxID=1227461 RepID=M0G5L1_HALPT|nr:MULTISPECIES: hypothetical protein [Haloferax]ELZ66847.1 hypothetical protein C457_12459 [Haloferax prahovense DSM 18310]RDZ44157.1 hypothetical protein C5B87_07965 [Haloferax sp. Atlit-16N]RDZ47645.1 hypothetical protein C5B86_00890 [Haloferax sp. Atlit-19N]RDZ58201.1 hypothetical protein C5B91_11530 [Haloferax sp. Atlit-10N]